MSIIGARQPVLGALRHSGHPTLVFRLLSHARSHRKDGTMKRIGKIASLLAAAALLVSAGVTYGQRQQEKSPEALEGKAAPAIVLKTLDGKDAKLADQKGKVVVLDFWATWCGPCRVSLPHLQSLANDTTLAEKGLVVWAVNVGETKDKIEPFMKENKYSFTVPMDSNSAVMKRYNVTGIPTTVVIGRDGEVKKAFVGFSPGAEKQIHDAVVKALEEEAPEA